MIKQVFKHLEKIYGPQYWWPAKTPFEVIVGAILTQNTSWSNVVKAIDNLKKREFLSFKKMLRVRPALLKECIRPAGYYNVKTKRLKNFLVFLQNECSGDLSRLFSQPLMKLRAKLLHVNGIGPETADSILLYAARKPIFVVDVYTKRIFSRIGLIREKETYESFQRMFMKSLPKSERVFNEYHALIVAHAKKDCLKIPRCRQCSLRPLCAYGRRQLLY